MHCKLVIFPFLTLPSVFAALSREVIANTLISAKENGENVKETFKTLEKGPHEDMHSMSWALVTVAREDHPDIVADSLRAVNDPHPQNEFFVPYPIYHYIWRIAINLSDHEFLPTMMASFTPKDVKPLAAFRSRIHMFPNPEGILKGVMEKNPRLMLNDLPKWIAAHGFNEIPSLTDDDSLKSSFRYLTFLASEEVLKEALTIVKKNAHHRTHDGDSLRTTCCSGAFPQDLHDRISKLLEFVKARNELVKDDALPFMPLELVGMILDYTGSEPAE